MKRMLALLLLCSPCFAGPVVTFQGGAALPLSKIEIEGAGKDDIGTTGGALGVQVMMPVNDRISVGFDFLNQAFGEKTSDTLLPPARATYSFISRTFLAGVRYEVPQDKLHPFVFGGLGFHSTKLTADLEPTPGIVWSDTRTREKRTIIDDTGTAFAGALGVGADYDVSSVVRFGLEARYSYLAETTWNTRSISATTSTLGEVKGAISAIALLARLSLRF